jgi:hypothetical protein
MTMPNKLSSLIAARCKSETENHIVKAGLERYEEVFTRHAILIRGTLKEISELLLLEAIHPLDLLLLTELNRVLRLLLPSSLSWAVLSGRIGAALHRALLGVALLPLQEQLLPLAAAKLTD